LLVQDSGREGGWVREGERNTHTHRDRERDRDRDRERKFLTKPEKPKIFTIWLCISGKVNVVIFVPRL
jgi:hypothetical protein